jgi:hypothetical protein
MDAKREFLRHALATLAYRAAKPLRDVPQGFADTRVMPASRSAVEIVAHMGDLMQWAARMCGGVHWWEPKPPREIKIEIARFFENAREFDGYLASDKPLGCPIEKLIQGPIADALTHVGQLATLRRVAGSPVRGENYSVADITIGQVGLDQPPARVEFD